MSKPLHECPINVERYMTSDLRLLLDEKLGHVGRCIYLECILWEWRSSRLPSNDAIARFSLSEVEDVRRFFQIAGDAYYKGDDGFRRNRVTQELRDEKLGKSAARRQARKGKFVDVLSEQNSNTDIVSRSRSRFQSGSSANGEEALKNGNWGELFTWWKSHGGGYSRVQLAAQYFSDRWNEPGKFAAMKATWPLWEASWESGVQIGELDNWLKNFHPENKPLVFTKREVPAQSRASSTVERRDPEPISREEAKRLREEARREFPNHPELGGAA